ncbi:hypothetical protein BC834DRAFT_966535 [Gloeopeniophorella convolvens]|nr:hypothetical protein BC834DRAFT_966535 [Gloeopeniophorella convolvens]
MIKIWSAYRGENGTAALAKLMDVGLVSETSKAIGFNQASLGSAPHKEVEQDAELWYTREDDSHEPLVVFEFRHRPASLLQAMDIMPRPARENVVEERPQTEKRPRSPSSTLSQPQKVSRTDKRSALRHASTLVETADIKLEHSDPVDEEAVLRSLQDSVKAIQNQIESLRARQGNNMSVKRERAPSPIRVGSANGEVIDLTLD